MNKDLYFIPLLDDAVSRIDTKTALTEAFKRIEALGHQPEYREGFMNFKRFMAEVEQKLEPARKRRNLNILIEREGSRLASVSLEHIPRFESVGGLRPGHYVIKLDTGRVLWEGALREEDLLWTAAFPDRPLAMAADTGDRVQEPTRLLRLLEGEVVIKVFPELEAGRMAIEIGVRE